ncbi:MAG: hypothetical protein QME64_10620 [bacterium]|nr:hypothetical protein [bacterium]
MSAKTIRNQIAELEALLDDWMRFRGIFEENSEIAMLTSDEFLELKNNIAQRQKILISVLEFEIEIGQMIMDIISRVSTTDYVAQVSDIARKRLESEWNTAFLFINETIGLLEKRLDHQVSITRPDQMFLNLFRSGGKGLVRIFQSTWFKFIIFLLVVALIIFGIFAFGILSWEDTKSHLPEFIQDLLP